MNVDATEPGTTNESCGRLSALQARIVSGLVLAPATIAIVIMGGWPFLVLIAVAALLSFYEFASLVLAGSRKYLHLLFVLAYLPVSYASYVYLRFGFAEGAWLALAVLLCVWASDIGAYVAGKTIGGPKLIPSLSPKKTWAGLAGAMLCSALALLILHFASGYLTPYIKADIGLGPGDVAFVFVAGLALGATGQAGDLLVSFYKRRVGAKDTGNLIPGHGGLLDRIDALLLVSPVFLGIVMLWL